MDYELAISELERLRMERSRIDAELAVVTQAVLDNMMALGVKSDSSGKYFNVAVVERAPVIEIDEQDKVPPEFTKVVPDKSSIAKYIKTGAYCDFATRVPQQPTLRVTAKAEDK